MAGRGPPAKRRERVFSCAAAAGRAHSFRVPRKIFMSPGDGLGTLLPISMLALTQVIRLRDGARRGLYVASGLLTLVGIFAMILPFLILAALLKVFPTWSDEREPAHV